MSDDPLFTARIEAELDVSGLPNEINRTVKPLTDSIEDAFNQVGDTIDATTDRINDDLITSIDDAAVRAQDDLTPALDDVAVAGGRSSDAFRRMQERLNDFDVRPIEQAAEELESAAIEADALGEATVGLGEFGNQGLGILNESAITATQSLRGITSELDAVTVGLGTASQVGSGAAAGLGSLGAGLANAGAGTGAIATAGSRLAAAAPGIGLAAGAFLGVASAVSLLGDSEPSRTAEAIGDLTNEILRLQGATPVTELFDEEAIRQGSVDTLFEFGRDGGEEFLAGITEATGQTGIELFEAIGLGELAIADQLAIAQVALDQGLIELSAVGSRGRAGPSDADSLGIAQQLLFGEGGPQGLVTDVDGSVDDLVGGFQRLTEAAEQDINLRDSILGDEDTPIIDVEDLLASPEEIDTRLESIRSEIQGFYTDALSDAEAQQQSIFDRFFAADDATESLDDLASTAERILESDVDLADAANIGDLTGDARDARDAIGEIQGAYAAFVQSVLDDESNTGLDEAVLIGGAREQFDEFLTTLNGDEGVIANIDLLNQALDDVDSEVTLPALDEEGRIEDLQLQLVDINENIDTLDGSEIFISVNDDQVSQLLSDLRSANALASSLSPVGQGFLPPSASGNESAFAFGGIALSQTSATIAEAGPEVVLPLNNPERSLQILESAANLLSGGDASNGDSSNGGGGGINIGVVQIENVTDLDDMIEQLREVERETVQGVRL